MSYYLGIDLGGTNIAVGAVDSGGRIIARESVPTRADRPFSQVVGDMVATAKGVLKQAKLDEGDISFVGVGVPSTIDPKTRRIVHANNLGWKNKDLIGEFNRLWKIPVRMGNDADLAALGESTGEVARDYKDVLMVTLGTGIGGGMILDGKIFNGGDGIGFEPGHMIIQHEGVKCTCGARGCFEAYGSVTGLIRQTLDMMISCPESSMWQVCGGDLNQVSGCTAFVSAKEGDRGALEVVEGYISYLASGIAGLLTLFRPGIIIIGGGISAEGEYLLKPLRQKVRERAFCSDGVDSTPIIQARLGNDAGIIGAAMLDS